MHERSFRIVLWSLALIGLAADQATKYGMFSWLAKVEGNAYWVFRHDHGSFRAFTAFDPATDDRHSTRGFKFDAQFEPDGSPHVNQGALFGFLRQHEKLANGGFAVVSLLAALAIGVWSMQPSTARDRWLCAALGLILAGTLGNLYDRVVFSGVRDFLHWHYGYNWPVFNIADCCLVCGAGLLLFQAFLAPAAKKSPSPVAAVPQTTQHS